MVIERQFSAEFQIEFVVESFCPFKNFFGLFLKIQRVVEARFHSALSDVIKSEV